MAFATLTDPDAQIKKWITDTYPTATSDELDLAISRVKHRAGHWDGISRGPGVIDYLELEFEVWAQLVEAGAPALLEVGEKIRTRSRNLTERRLDELLRVLPWLWRHLKDELTLDHSDIPALQRSRVQKRAIIDRFISEESFDFNRLCEGLDLDQAAIPQFFPTLEELEAERILKAEAIFKSYHRLRKIMMHYENDIGRRFLKRNEQKRRHLIQDAWNDSVIPDEPIGRQRFPKEHFPAYQAHYDGIVENKRTLQGDELFYSWILPSCVNLHDLASKNPAVLQMLLHHRSHNDPDIFYFLDISQFRFEAGDFFGEKGPAMPYETHYGMEFFGNKTPDKYGRLMAVEEAEDSRRGHSCALGMTLLDAQRRLYAFLLSICLKILQKDLATLDALPEKPAKPVEVEPQYIASGPDDLLTFRYPGRWEDMDAMIPEIKARRDAAVSHLIALRNQPDYLASYMIEEFNHVPEHSVLADGTIPPERDTQTLLQRSILMVVSDAFGKLICWDKLHVVFLEMRDRFKEFQMSDDYKNSVEKGLPDDLKGLISYCDVLLETNYTLFYTAVSRVGSCAPKLRELTWIKPHTHLGMPPLMPRYPNWRGEGGTRYGIYFRLGNFGQGTPQRDLQKL
ncbi:hypothetical protein N7540_010737 [Penicillium herquei]|nr:hypothetical protein N7540_010737 [Penicillium herquei]